MLQFLNKAAKYFNYRNFIYQTRNSMLSKKFISNLYISHLESNRLKLNHLKDNPGARQKRTRRGRGHNSGRGRKSGRGMKGNTAHTGLVRKDYIGGTKPLHLKIPKRGKTHKKREYNLVNLDKIGSFIDEGRLCAQKPITIKVMVDSGLTKKVKNGVKIVSSKKVPIG